MDSKVTGVCGSRRGTFPMQLSSPLIGCFPSVPVPAVHLLEKCACIALTACSSAVPASHCVTLLSMCLYYTDSGTECMFHLDGALQRLSPHINFGPAPANH
eukprot:566197-Pelagomonas_calceolata.AAC.5